LYIFHRLSNDLVTICLGHSLHPYVFMAISFLVVVLLASISYRILEKPFLNLKKRFEVV
jgi:peptidoglycan/LPS O-acetylase OafA/YrhL